jgi:four helix bundle protein
MGYDLEPRTLKFARDVRDFLKDIPRTIANTEYCRQVIRSSGSIGANYIEANESLSKRDFFMRVKICRKEAKETGYWLQLIEFGTEPRLNMEQARLLDESIQLMKIFASIIHKDESRDSKV